MREVVRKPILVQPADASQSPLYVWNGGANAGPGSPLYVTIDLSQQKAYVFKNRQNIAWTYVATGRPGFATPTGTFNISEKIVDKRSNRYGSIVNSAGEVVNSNATPGSGGGHFVGAPMPYWMRLTSYGVGMHAGAIPYPGAPASHGCIRLPYAMAERIYSEAGYGTRVTIVP
ncbi:MAG: L,D-transpeptidase family protein [Prosthecobacter sp.]|nr:L,D-transpeptidase family protein [Prosthecobacter sp.]